MTMKLVPGKLDKDILSNRSREELESLILMLQGEVHDLRKQNLEKDMEIANLREINRMRLLEKYMPSSEQMASLFDELELYDLAQPVLEDEGRITVSAHEKTRKQAEISSMPASTPVYDVYHTEGAAESYTDDDGIEYRRIEDEIVSKIAYVPQRVVVERHHYPKYRAVCAVEEGKETEVAMRSRSIDALAASPSFISYVAVSKYDDHLPLYRLSEILGRSGIRVSRQKMAGWLIKYMEALLPFSRFWDRTVFRQRFLAMDESPVKILDVLNAEGKPSANCYMVFRRGSSYIARERRTHVLISYRASIGRSSCELLNEYRRMEFPGYVMTDGLSGYNTIEKHCTCWVHAARPFKKMLKDSRKNGDAQRICIEVARLFSIDEELRKKLEGGIIGEDEFLAERRRKSLKIMEGIFAFCASLSLRYTPQSQMGKALAYITERQDTLRNYLEAVEATPSNNESERCAKAFATGRKNWLFSKAVDGADASAFFYSIIESAKANGIDPLLYTELICTEGPYCTTEEEMERLLPWNADLSGMMEECRKRNAAAPDKDRKNPYMLTGLRR